MVVGICGCWLAVVGWWLWCWWLFWCVFLYQHHFFSFHRPIILVFLCFLFTFSIHEQGQQPQRLPLPLQRRRGNSRKRKIHQGRKETFQRIDCERSGLQVGFVFHEIPWSCRLPVFEFLPSIGDEVRERLRWGRGGSGSVVQRWYSILVGTPSIGTQPFMVLNPFWYPFWSQSFGTHPLWFLLPCPFLCSLSHRQW